MSKNLTCTKCSIFLRSHWITEGMCNGCKNPDSIVTASDSIYIYFNGSFFYRSTDSHYKHGRAWATCFDAEEAERTIARLEIGKGKP